MALDLKLTLPSDNLSVGQTSATVEINYSGLSQLKNETSDTTKTSYSDIELQYSFNNSTWSKIPNDDEVTKSSLTAGAKNTFTVYCRRQYTVTTSTKGADGSWSSGTPSTKTDSKINKAITVYTKHSTTSWSWGATKGGYIDQVLTTTNITNWRAYLRVYQSWYWQDDKSSSYSALVPDADDDVSAAWYNNCYNARHNKNTTKVNGLSTHGTAATYISAALINDLNFEADDWTKRNWSL